MSPAPGSTWWTPPWPVSRIELAINLCKVTGETLTRAACQLLSLQTSKDSLTAPLQDSHCSSPGHRCHKMTCSECPQGWTSNPANDRCYKHVEERRSWAGARAWCKGNGGDLASAPDQDTRTFLSTLTDDQAWIGENNNV